MQLKQIQGNQVVLESGERRAMPSGHLASLNPVILFEIQQIFTNFHLKKKICCICHLIIWNSFSFGGGGYFNSPLCEDKSLI